MKPLLPLLLCFLSLVWAPSARAEGTTTLRVATLAPKRSPWGKVFAAWQKALHDKTGGKLKLKVFYNGVTGAEDAMVSKLRTGQLDGASLTSVGLSRLYRDVLVLQLPGVLDSWPLLDRARAALRPELEQGFAREGIQILSWGDVGMVRLMSRGAAVRRPEDLRGRRPSVWRNEPIGPALYASIGGVVPVPVSMVEVLPALRSRKIDTLSAPALAAEQLQWSPSLEYIAERGSVCAIGALVMRQSSIEALPADLRAVFDELQAKMNRAGSARIRQLDDAAFERQKKKLQVVPLSPADRQAWRVVIERTVERLAGGTFPRALVERVLQLSGKEHG